MHDVSSIHLDGHFRLLITYLHVYLQANGSLVILLLDVFHWSSKRVFPVLATLSLRLSGTANHTHNSHTHEVCKNRYGGAGLRLIT
jgi:hypothetical protein